MYRVHGVRACATYIICCAIHVTCYELLPRGQQYYLDNNLRKSWLCWRWGSRDLNDQDKSDILEVEHMCLNDQVELGMLNVELMWPEQPSSTRHDEDGAHVARTIKLS